MRSLQHIRAVTFDVGGTLIRPWPSVGRIYAEVAEQHGLKGVSHELLERRFGEAWRGLTQFNHGRDEWSALVDRVFEGLSEPPPSESFFPNLFDRFAEPDAWRIFEDVKPAIDALAARGINLGIISNWDERLEPLLEKLGLRKYFETVVISCEVGFAKPSPVIFEHATRKMGVAPEFILHVGDSVREDAQGAKSAGYHALLIERDGQDPRAEAIKSLCDLDGVLAGAGERG